VQREGADGAVQHALLHDAQPTAGDLLLGGLEDAADGAGQPGLPGEGQGDAEQHRGVHVVPAGVAEAGAGGGVLDVLEVGQRQRVDVGAQHHDRAAVPAVRPRRDVADQPGAAGQPARVQPGGAQPLLEEGGGLVLGEAELGMRVQVPADRDQLVGVGGGPGVDSGPDPCRGRHAGVAPGRSFRSSATRLSTTGRRSPPWAAATARCRW
jgi:hypothetical protein